MEIFNDISSADENIVNNKNITVEPLFKNYKKTMPNAFIHL
jgi:hypothetical protein